MRGKRTESGRQERRVRIIPARAGQTSSGAAELNSDADHPRACGANVADWAALSAVAGSSPRVRGKLSQRYFVAGVKRIIPARAGQTRGHAVPAMRAPDHPRACGANHLLADIADNTAGSSPRVRGKPGWGRKRKAYLRIIPARAGQTGPPPGEAGEGPDHPRACGANLVSSLTGTSLAGSSPRVRGKRAGAR